jgi:hypothetical protein
VAIFLISFFAQLGFAQPKNPAAPPPPLAPAEGERVARELLSNLLAQKPAENATSTGTLKIRGPDRHEREIPVRFEIRITPTNWLGIYEAAPVGDGPGERFTVVHTDGAPDEFLLQPLGGLPGTNTGPRKLTGSQLMTPLAGSDFWLVDLGLEFLHWPQQRVLKKEMKRDLFCDVLQSTNSAPSPGAYSRVVSWIAANRPEEIVIAQAQAYDKNDKLLKEFNPKKVRKINGVWQLESMEIRNLQTGSRTRLQFNLEH